MKSSLQELLLGAMAIVCFSVSAQAQIFTGDAGVDGNGNYDYNNGANWVGGNVPSTATGGTAVINNGLTATWYGAGDGGDFIVANGGELEVSNGGWQQVTNNNYIQLEGNGTILVNGGSFNQGTASSVPFNIAGTGNVFTITSGTANFTTPFAASTGLTVNFAGGTVTTAGEFDYNSNTMFMSGGVLNTTLMTGVNSGGIGSFQLSGGTINLSSSQGIYGADDSHPLNFTTGSTGVINFANVNTATVEGYLTNGIELNGVNDPGAFTVTSAFGGDGATLELTSELAVPEPSTYLMLGLGLAFLFAVRRNRRLVACRD